MKFTKQQILDHRGTVSIFCPHIEPDKSTYKLIRDVRLFVQTIFESQFRPEGRIEERQMLICAIPRPLHDDQL